jgi:predicted acyl esterase
MAALIVTAYPRAVREIEHCFIPLRDGTRLAARIWLPRDAERDPVPAILEYLPYRKRDGTYERDALTHPYLAGHGYAGVRVDIRGSGESDGLLTDEYAPQEQDDALEIIAWLAAQPWCSGAVGMMGISWGGFNGLQVAARRPPALRAVVTICSTDDRFRDDVHAMGGALLTAKFGWASFFFGAMGHAPDPALVGDGWRETWVRRLENLPLFLEIWLRHQRRDAYWRHGSVCEDYAAIACPVFAVGGWTDGYTNAIPRLLEHLSVPRKGLIGPWAHAYPHFAQPGPQIGFLQEMLRWWDHWLKGIDTGVMAEPMLRAWMIESLPPAPYNATLPGHWVGAPCWPPPDRATRRLSLTDDGLRDAASGEAGGTLTPRAVCSPQTLGAAGGSWCPFGRGPDQAGDQRPDDARSLLFETAPLDAPVAILGAALVTLDVASDRPIANLAVRLCDVQPGAGRMGGASLRVSYGVLNLTHRDGHAAPAPGCTHAQRGAAGSGPAGARAYPAERCGLRVSGRPPHPAGAVHHLLADDLAKPGGGDRDGVRGHAGSADARAAGRGRAGAAARAADGASGESDGAGRRRDAHRPDRAGTGRRRTVRVPCRGRRSAERHGADAADGNRGARCVAHADRHAYAPVLHAGRFRAARHDARAGSR